MYQDIYVLRYHTYGKYISDTISTSEMGFDVLSFVNFSQLWVWILRQGLWILSCEEAINPSWWQNIIGSTQMPTHAWSDAPSDTLVSCTNEILKDTINLFCNKMNLCDFKIKYVHWLCNNIILQECVYCISTNFCMLNIRRFLLR
jgi:hypothetical protein